ncbi:hypothetical protein [Flavobacterium selenitireducens]|uniref:hypothetical protein n=1 Tax=Flavobacterium selenitireducens TaxID=2722704 RepID=UPI00168B3C88|nr:hypothetical protein [Flavobacterium selenitireducens]MBD3583507.1 hypothetical protein [Flavobacterium selenitireducens]
MPAQFAPEFAIGWNNIYFRQGDDETGETAAFYETVGDLPSNFLTPAQYDAHNLGLEITYTAQDGTFNTSKGDAQTESTLSVSDYAQAVKCAPVYARLSRKSRFSPRW